MPIHAGPSPRPNATIIVDVCRDDAAAISQNANLRKNGGRLGPACGDLYHTSENADTLQTPKEELRKARRGHDWQRIAIGIIRPLPTKEN